MTKERLIFEMDAFELINWIDNNPLFMAYLYALERAGVLGGEND